MSRQAAIVVVALVLCATPLRAQVTLFTVTAASADVHIAPSTGSRVIGQALRGRTFEVTRDLGSWVRVEWPDAPDGVAYLHVTWGTMSGVVEAEGTSGTRTASRHSSDPTSPDSVEAPDPRPGVRVLSLPSHVIGLGGRTGIQAQGFAVTGRAWTHRRFGIQIEAGKSTHASAVTSDRLNTLQIAPSLIYPLPDLVNYYFWLRPYVGGGASVYRSTLGLSPGVPAVVKQGLGYQAFSGAEVTWAGLRQVALSVDLRQQWAPTMFNGFESGGLGVSLSRTGT